MKYVKVVPAGKESDVDSIFERMFEVDLERIAIEEGEVEATVERAAELNTELAKLDAQLVELGFKWELR